MPYRKYTQIIEGKKKWCAQNLRTKKIIHFDSFLKREHGLRIREIAAHVPGPYLKRILRKRV